MAPGGRDLQRPLGAFLALDLAQVGHGLAAGQGTGLRRAQHLASLEMIDQGDQGPRRQNTRPAGPGGFRPR